MSEVVLLTAHTSELDTETLSAARALLYDAFDDMTEADWEHALGGIHAMVRAGDELVGHASVVQRRLLHAGRAWRTGYVEGVAVRAGHRRRGHAAAMMTALERVIDAAYDLGALGATDEAFDFYTGRGWRPWRGRTYTVSPTGRVRTADEDGAVLVLDRRGRFDLDGELSADWRDGDVW